MDNKLQFYTASRGTAGACAYYRILTPFNQIEKLGLANTYIEKGDHYRQDLSLKLMFHSDVILLYSIGGADPLHQVETLKKIKPAKINNTWKYPPTLIYDSDDNADYVHFMNETFGHLGVRSYPDGKFLEPSSETEQTILSFKWEEDGEFEEFWKDKETVGVYGVPFDIAKNLQEMKIRHKIIQNCHGATASTPLLASYFKEVLGQKNVHVFPNTIVLEDYEFFDTNRKDDKIRILWQGSISHWVDWFPLRSAIKAISEKYKNKITWVIYGTLFKWIKDVIPPDMIEFCSWSPYDAYRLRRGLLNIDINLCPLEDNIFNRCKSAIKWYEGSIWPNPEATLASKVGPYFEIQNGKTGLLYTTEQEFVDKLSALIENPELRKTLGNNAKKWVMNNRLPEHTIPPLYEFYTETRERQKRELNPLIQLGTDADMKRLIKEREFLPAR